MCAFRFGWTDSQVYALDVGYALELSQALAAKADEEAAQARTRARTGQQGNWMIEEVSIDEIE